jgi:hypothetical protein
MLVIFPFNLVINQLFFNLDIWWCIIESWLLIKLIWWWIKYKRWKINMPYFWGCRSFPLLTHSVFESAKMKFLRGFFYFFHTLIQFFTHRITFWTFIGVAWTRTWPWSHPNRWGRPARSSSGQCNGRRRCVRATVVVFVTRFASPSNRATL